MKSGEHLQNAVDLSVCDTELNRLVETLPARAWRASADGARHFHTRRWHDYTGLSPDDANGWGWRSVIHPDDLQRLLDEWQSIRTRGRAGQIEARVKRFDGEYRWSRVHVDPIVDASGTIEGWYGCATDIHDQKRIEERLRQGEEELKNVVDAICEVVAVVAPDGSLTHVNRYFRSYTGRVEDTFEATEWRQLTCHPDELAAMERERMQGIRSGDGFSLEYRIRRGDGQFRLHQIRYSPLRDNTGSIVRWYACAIDIHEQKRAAERLQNENLVLREDITNNSMFEEIVGSSEPMQRVLKQLAKVSVCESTVLVLGETGTGKELIARAVHAHSPRFSKAFIRVNCAAIPASLIASELFGHEKGAFTGAVHTRIGRFEAADGGTLFLDEIGELPAETQVALLRVLQEREFERVGSNVTISVDVRVVAATNRNLLRCVEAGTFREDLYYRLNVFPLNLPSLRERTADIPLLVRYFIARYARKSGKRFDKIAAPTLTSLMNYAWPGNIRELQNVIERGVILCDDPVFSIEEDWLTIRAASPKGTESLASDVKQHERALIRKALDDSKGRIAGPAGAAARLGIPRTTLLSKMKSLGIGRQ